jgi:hypothetical protein
MTVISIYQRHYLPINHKYTNFFLAVYQAMQNLTFSYNSNIYIFAYILLKSISRFMIASTTMYSRIINNIPSLLYHFDNDLPIKN